MDCRTWLHVWSLVPCLFFAAVAAAQQPTWFNAGPPPAELTAGGGYGMQQPMPLPPVVTPAQAIVPPAQGNLLVEPAAYATAAMTTSTFDTDSFQAQAPLDQQLAAMAKRLDALEHPPVKYPAGVQVLGVFQADGVTFNQDQANRAPAANGGVGYIENGADFRRARLAAKASLANNMNGFFQMDFAFPGRPTFTDVWVEWTDLPVVGTIRAGQWKQPFSLEVVSSFRYTTFMERSLVFQAFTPFRHIGVGAYNHADDLMGTWAASYLRTGQDQFGGSLSTAGGNGFTGRLTRLAWYDEEAGRSYLHLGGDYYLNVPPHHSTVFRSIPEIFVGQNANGPVGTAGFAVPGAFDGTPFFANTGTLANVQHVHTFDLEAMWVYGPLSVQAEYMPVIVDRANEKSAYLDGGYVQVGYFLTGEHRPYDRVAGAIDRVRPFEDFFLARTGRGIERGMGAWEVAVRFSHLDLNNDDISGGVVNDLTFGVNWFCNPFCKVVFNYIHAWRQSPTNPPNTGAAPAVAVASEMNAFGLRTQMDF